MNVCEDNAAQFHLKNVWRVSFCPATDDCWHLRCSACLV